MSKVDEAVVEIETEITDLADEYAGLLDYSRLDLKPATMAKVKESIVEYERRGARLHAANQALKALQADGHPGIPIKEVEASVLENLQENAATIEAALKRFASNEAVDMGLKAEKPEPKP